MQPGYLAVKTNEFGPPKCDKQKACFITFCSFRMGLLFPLLSMALNSIHLVYQVIYFWGASLNGALFTALNSFAMALLPSTEQRCPTRFFPPAEWIQWIELSSVFQIAQLLCNTPPTPTSHVSLPLLSVLESPAATTPCFSFLHQPVKCTTCKMFDQDGWSFMHEWQEEVLFTHCEVVLTGE